MKKRSKRHRPEQIVKKLRDAEVMLNNGKNMDVRAVEVGYSTIVLVTVD